MLRIRAHQRLFASIVQSFPTPNENSLKFVYSSRPVALSIKDKNARLEFTSLEEARYAPLAKAIMESFPQVIKSVFYGPDYITIEKDKQFQHTWDHIRPTVCRLIAKHFDDNTPFILDTTQDPEAARNSEQECTNDDQELMDQVRLIMDTRIRPSIQDDGGDVQIMGLNQGWVKLKLQGACRSCSSSTVTLR